MNEYLNYEFLVIGKILCGSGTALRITGALTQRKLMYS